MDLLFAAEPWTYWAAPLLTLLSVVGVLGVCVAYLIKVVAARYPKQ